MNNKDQKEVQPQRMRRFFGYPSLPVFALLWVPAAGFGQTAGPDFEVASVKPDKSLTRPVIPHFSGNRFLAVNVPLAILISTAWNLPFNPGPRLTGAPDWSRSERFDIEATVGEGTFPAGLSASAVKEKQFLMLRKLLEDRFQLRIVPERRELPVYAIVIEKDGLKLQKSAMDEAACAAVPAPSGPGNIDTMPCHEFLGGQGRGLHARAVGIGDLARYVENWAERPVVDKTQVRGLYRVETAPWIPMRVGADPPADAKGENGSLLADMPTLFEVFRRMGLRLDSQKEMVDVFRIERVARPSEN